MPKFRITNLTLGSVTLPEPYEIILPPGKGVIVEGSEAGILAVLGGPAGILGVLQLQQVSEGNALTVFPSVPTPEFSRQVIVTYARMTGNDDTGDGLTEETAYRTYRKAERVPPLNSPPGVQHIIDISGDDEVLFEEELPDNYCTPAWKAPLVFDEDFSDTLSFYHPAVLIRARPRLVAAIPPADAVVDIGDIASIVNDPVNGLITYTLNVARPSWGVNGLQGKFVIDPVDSFLHAPIHENTTLTLSVCDNAPLNFPFSIRECSAHLSGKAVLPGFQGAFSIMGCDSAGIIGVKVTSTDGGLGLFIVGGGFPVVSLCELESPDVETRNNFVGRFTRNYVYGFPFLGGDLYVNHCFMKDCTGGAPGFNFWFGSPTIMQVSRTVFDGCDAVGFISLFLPDGSGDQHIPERASVSTLRMNSTLIRNGLEEGFVFSGGQATIMDTNIVNCKGHGILANEGAGKLRLINVRSNGLPNGVTSGGGVRLDDGTFVVVDAATSCPLISGTGDSFTFAADIVTLADAAADFTPAMVGAKIVIDGATSPDNNGTFTVLTVNGPGTEITYSNPDGVTEAFAGTWSTTQPLIGGLGEISVGDLPDRTWLDFTDAIPASGHPQHNEYDITLAAATGAIGTGSRLYQK